MSLSTISQFYIGQTEQPGNVFDPKSEFGSKLKNAGHVDGHPWCALFAEVCAKEAYPDKFDEFDSLFSASAVQTFKNFKKADYEISLDPFVDALVIWQKYINGVAQWQGHAGIVIEVLKDNWFRSVEGNTNAAGSREGTTVAVKQRPTILKAEVGLVVMGFIRLE